MSNLLRLDYAAPPNILAGPCFITCLLPMAATATLIFLAIGLSACAAQVSDRQRLCAEALSGIELDAADLRIVRMSERQFLVTIEFVVESELHRIDCRFAFNRIQPAGLDIVEIGINGKILLPTQLQILKRFWLSEIEMVGERRRLELPQPEPPLILPTTWAYVMQQVVNALPLAAIYALLALAYALIYGLTQRINLAFGEMTAFAAIVAIIGFTQAAGLGLAAAIAAAAVAGFLAALIVASLVGRTLFRPLAFRSGQAILVATLGLSIALQEAMRLAFGSDTLWLPQILGAPVVLAGGDFTLVATPGHAVIVMAAAAAISTLFVALRVSRFGLSWRAVADDPGAARLMGIDPDKVVAGAFLAAAGLIALAGTILSLAYGTAQAGMGLVIGLKALVAAVVGGIGSLAGAAIGGIILAVLETLWTAYFPAGYRDVFVFGCLVAALIFRPDGLFGRSRQPRV